MKQTIALIDDDRNILTSLSIALEKEGFKVQTYLDGESALIGLARTPPDLAVIDIKMPKMDGQEHLNIGLIELVDYPGQFMQFLLGLHSVHLFHLLHL